jgi:chromosome segregation ATPase
MIRQSLDNQIQEAKRRASSYAQSMKNVREQEANAVRTLEEERDKWARSCEQKSVMVEQLERELKSAVDALETQRLHQVTNGLNRTVRLDVEQINSNFKRLINLTDNDNFSQNFSTTHPSLPEMSMRRSFDGTNNTLYNDSAQSTPLADVTVESVQALNNILEQYKEQLQQSRLQVSNAVTEKQQLINKIMELTQELTQIIDEREQLKIAHTDFEGKLQFRANQVNHEQF